MADPNEWVDQLLTAAVVRSESVKDDNLNERAQVNLAFFCKLYLNEIINSEHSVVSWSQLIESQWRLNLDLDELKDLPDRQEYIKERLANSFLELDEDDADWFSKELVKSTIDSSVWSKALSGGYNVVNIDVQLTHNLSHYQDVEPENQLMDLGTPVAMVPATEESINTLERKRVPDDFTKDCVICLEELSKGCEAIVMPCSHWFHEDCIVGWLNTSHVCPMCRFQMPKAETQEVDVHTYM